MLYWAYQMHRAAGAPARAACRLTAKAIDGLPPALREGGVLRRASAVCDIVVRSHPTHRRPAFGIHSVRVDGQAADVAESVVTFSPFASLIHFTKPSVSSQQPTVLVVGPMSGHFTTLIRGTIRSALADHDVYVLDWHNARDIPVEHGTFGLDDFVEHVVDALRSVGPGAHVIAVCQPAVPVLAAVALMAADDDPCAPGTTTLIAGPIDTRVSPNRLNRTAVRTPIARFDRVIATVPPGYAGAGRPVYPGFLQLAAFMSLDPRRHLAAHAGLYRNMVKGDAAKAAATRAFYDEYGAVMDVPAEFYLETVSRVFQQHLLAKNALRWRGRRVDVGAIRRTRLLTVEGSADDICPPGQTRAAHALCTGLPPDLKEHYLAEGVGHYGVFSGSTWERDIYPVIRSFIGRSESEGASARTGIVR